MNKETIEKLYKELMESVKTDKFYQLDLADRVNCYACKGCGYITKTIDVDAGVTPACIRCEKCMESAWSSFYRDIAPDEKPTLEWYRPTLEDTLKMSEVMQDHILKGGLADRKIEVKSVNRMPLDRDPDNLGGTGHGDESYSDADPGL